MQKNEQNEKERRNFEEKLEALDRLKEDYQKKRSDIMIGIEKLRLKEDLLEQKEKDIRAQRLAFDKHRYLWETEHHSEAPVPVTNPPVQYLSHGRANSFSTFASLSPSYKKTETFSSNLKEENKSQSTTEKTIEYKTEQLKQCQIELKDLEAQLLNGQDNPNVDVFRSDLKIDQLRNKIATLRGEIAMSESTKASRLISSMVVTMKRESVREDRVLMNQFADEVNSKLGCLTPRLPAKSNFNIPIKPKPLEAKTFDNNSGSVNKRLLFTENPTNKINTNTRGEKEELSKNTYDRKKKKLFELEKELAQKEAFLQQTWMRIPGAKELIENVSLTLNKLNSEKAILERERDEFENEKIEWIKSKEKVVISKMKDGKKEREFKK